MQPLNMLVGKLQGSLRLAAHRRIESCQPARVAGIHYTRNWNPGKEDQSTDRSSRSRCVNSRTVMSFLRDCPVSPAVHQGEKSGMGRHLAAGGGL